MVLVSNSTYVLALIILIETHLSKNLSTTMDECYLPQANIIHLILQNQSVLTTFLYFYSVLSEMNTKVFSKGNMYSWLQTHLVVQNVSSMNADNCSCLPTAHTQAKLPCSTLSSSPSSFHLAQGLFWSRGERERGGGTHSHLSPHY